MKTVKCFINGVEVIIKHNENNWNWRAKNCLPIGPFKSAISAQQHAIHTIQRVQTIEAI